MIQLFEHDKLDSALQNFRSRGICWYLRFRFFPQENAFLCHITFSISFVFELWDLDEIRSFIWILVKIYQSSREMLELLLKVYSSRLLHFLNQNDASFHKRTSIQFSSCWWKQSILNDPFHSTHEILISLRKWSKKVTGFRPNERITSKILKKSHLWY